MLFFKLLFSDDNGEWHTIVTSDPNQEIIRRLDSGNPDNIYELFSILERKIKIWEVNPETSEDNLSLTLSITSYKNKIGPDPGYEAQILVMMLFPAV